jgi:hypothetical protein
MMGSVTIVNFHFSLLVRSIFLVDLASSMLFVPLFIPLSYFDRWGPFDIVASLISTLDLIAFISHSIEQTHKFDWMMFALLLSCLTCQSKAFQMQIEMLACDGYGTILLQELVFVLVLVLVLVLLWLLLLLL